MAGHSSRNTQTITDCVITRVGKGACAVPTIEDNELNDGGQVGKSALAPCLPFIVSMLTGGHASLCPPYEAAVCRICGSSRSPQPSQSEPCSSRPRKNGEREKKRTRRGRASLPLRANRHCEERQRRLVRRSSTSEGGSNPFLRRRRSGLLRGACHRARIRATRWLAMTILDTRVRQIDPTGKSVAATKTCPALSQKIFRFRRRANQFYQLAPSFPGKRGASRSSRTRDGMRWTRQRWRANGVAGQALPVSEEPARRRTALQRLRQNFGWQHMAG